MAGSGMKLLPPDKYDGETDFERFAKLLNAYMGCEDQDYPDILRNAAARTTHISVMSLVAFMGMKTP